MRCIRWPWMRIAGSKWFWDTMVGSRPGPLHAPHTTPHSHRPQICTWTAEIDVCRRCLLTGARSRTPHVLARSTTAPVHGSGIYVIMYAYICVRIEYDPMMIITVWSRLGVGGVLLLLLGLHT